MVESSDGERCAEYPELLAKCDILQRDLLTAPKNQKHGTTNGQN
jgi:hypothetical protein